MVTQEHVQKNEMKKKFKTQDANNKGNCWEVGAGDNTNSQYLLPIFSVNLKLLFTEMY